MQQTFQACPHCRTGPCNNRCGRYRRPTSGTAIAGFVLSFVTGLFGLIVCIAALREIRRSNGMLGGEGLAQGGIVVSIISTIVAISLAANPG